MTFEDTLNEAVKAYNTLLATVEDLTKLPTDFEQRVNEIFAQQLQARHIKVSHPGNDEGKIPLAIEMNLPAPNLYYVVTGTENPPWIEEVRTYQAKEGTEQIPTNRNGWIQLYVVPKEDSKSIDKVVIDFIPSLRIPEQDYGLIAATAPNYRTKIGVWAVSDDGEVAHALHKTQHGTMIGILDDGNVRFYPLTGDKSSYSGPKISVNLSLGGDNEIHRISVPPSSLGTGLLTVFFKHNQYESMDLLAR